MSYKAIMLERMTIVLIPFLALCLSLLVWVSFTAQFSIVLILSMLLMIFVVRLKEELFALSSIRWVDLLLVFFLWVLLSFIWSVDFALSIRYAMLFYLFVLAFLCGLLLWKNSLHLFSCLLLLLALTLFATSLYQTISMGVERPPGLFDHANASAALYLIGLCFCMCAYLFEERHTRSVYGLVIAVLACGLGMTQSRSNFLALLIILLLLLYTIWERQGDGRSLRRYYTMLAWGALGLIMENILTTGSVSRLVATLQSLDPSSRRFTLWSMALDSYWSSPLLGSGIGTLNGSFVTHFTSGTASVRSPHNDYLQLLAELGPLGLMLFLAYVFLLLAQFKRVRTIVVETPRDWPIYGAWFALLTLFVHFLFHYHLYNATFILLLGLFSGVIAGSHQRGTKYIPVSATVGTRGVMLVLVVVMFSVLYISRFASDHLLHTALNQAESQVQPHSEVMRQLQRAAAVAPYRTEPKLALGNALEVYLQRQQLSVQEQQDTIEQAYSYYQQAKRNSSFSYKPYLATAKLMQRYPARFAAHSITDNYERALQLRPNKLIIYLLYSDYYRQEGDAVAALEVLHRAGGRWFSGRDWELAGEYCEKFTALHGITESSQKHSATTRPEHFCSEYLNYDRRFAMWIR